MNSEIVNIFDDFVKNEIKNCYFNNLDFEKIVKRHPNIFKSAFDGQRNNVYIVRRYFNDRKVQEFKYKNIFEALYFYEQNDKNDFFIERNKKIN